MTNQHPITPPPELVQQWWATETYDPFGVALLNLATKAAQWGSDQELEACCEWLDFYAAASEAKDLRTARRPKPPSLKEQALEQLNGIATCFRATHGGDIVCDKIRKALEALPDD